MNITIFGSCRQNPIRKNFAVTGIQEALTYSHYTREIIQAIQFCRGESTLTEDDTRNAFRSGILNKSCLHSSQFIGEFESTDMFVIEIASRLSYSYKEYYVHHILTEEKYGFPDADNIHIHELCDEEIEADILRIRDLLHPRPFLIASHIYTRKSGKRYDLVMLLNKLCKKHEIPFFDPSAFLEAEKYQPSQVYLQEPVLVHFTPFCQGVLANKYKEIINGLIMSDIHYLTVYKTEHRKFRFGNVGDGGYIVADVGSYGCLLSCGISDNMTFELDFADRHKIPIYAFDGNIAKPPAKHSLITFIRKNIGGTETRATTNMHELIARYDDIFVKMDIESFEYQWIDSLSIQQLNKLKQLVIEFHFPFTKYPRCQPGNMDVFKKLSKTHVLIHFHPNNCCGTCEYQGIIVPNVFECTYLRKDIANISGLNTDAIPGQLDSKNVIRYADIKIDYPPFVNIAPIQKVVVRTVHFTPIQELKKGGSWGLGDILRGLITVYYLCKEKGYNLKVDMTMHPLGLLPAENSGEKPVFFSGSYQQIADKVRNLLQSEQETRFFTNGPLEIYSMKPGADKELTALVNSILCPVERPSYTVVHVRLGDMHMNSDAIPRALFFKALRAIRPYLQQDTLLMSDSTVFKHVIKKHFPNITILEGEPTHIGKGSNTDFTMLEYEHLICSKHIYTYSVYGWVSGFAKSASYLYGIPLTVLNHARGQSMKSEMARV
jgi:hypothetical protein